mmetsp:Transcript_9501/g.17142  ORF Transcript_9501/g.17142 Transcript_9501/m.17142 type:complete len:114 (-) Transcript_9501:210-551(-)
MTHLVHNDNSWPDLKTRAKRIRRNHYTLLETNLHILLMAMILVAQFQAEIKAGAKEAAENMKKSDEIYSFKAKNPKSKNPWRRNRLRSLPHPLLFYTNIGQRCSSLHKPAKRR